VPLLSDTKEKGALRGQDASESLHLHRTSVLQGGRHHARKRPDLGDKRANLLKGETDRLPDRA